MAKKTSKSLQKFTTADQLPQDVKQLSGIDTLRIIRYSDFSDLEWQYALKIAEHRDLDPLVGQVHFFKRPTTDKKAKEVSFMIGIEGMRLIAYRTGTLGGAGECEFEYDGKGNLSCCIFKAEKKVDGEWRTVIGRAYREEYITSAMGSYAADFPKGHLEKCAEAACYRRGWPQELGRIYCEEEVKTMKAKPAPVAPPANDGFDDLPPNDVPEIQLQN